MEPVRLEQFSPETRRIFRELAVEIVARLPSEAAHAHAVLHYADRLVSEFIETDDVQPRLRVVDNLATFVRRE
jgi:hypothetical protein